LRQPLPKTPQANLDLAREYFEEWLPSSAGFLKGYHFFFAERDWKKSAFMLHQAAETLSLRPAGLHLLHPSQSQSGFPAHAGRTLDLRLVDAWPRDGRKERAMFEKLKDAYVKARYSKHYQITQAELLWLGERVEELGRVVHTLCSERLAALEAAVRTGQTP
jgi:HEPN domain-containing protein